MTYANAIILSLFERLRYDDERLISVSFYSSFLFIYCIDSSISSFVNCKCVKEFSVEELRKLSSIMADWISVDWINLLNSSENSAFIESSIFESIAKSRVLTKIFKSSIYLQ